MALLQGVALIAALLTMGLMAGVFFLYTVAVMPGLGRTDHRTFVGAFQAIDRAIINPVFLLCFLGALGLTGSRRCCTYRPTPVRCCPGPWRRSCSTWWCS